MMIPFKMEIAVFCADCSEKLTFQVLGIGENYAELSVPHCPKCGAANTSLVNAQIAGQALILENENLKAANDKLKRALDAALEVIKPLRSMSDVFTGIDTVDNFVVDINR